MRPRITRGGHRVDGPPTALTRSHHATLLAEAVRASGDELGPGSQVHMTHLGIYSASAGNTASTAVPWDGASFLGARCHLSAAVVPTEQLARSRLSVPASTIRPARCTVALGSPDYHGDTNVPLFPTNAVRHTNRISA